MSSILTSYAVRRHMNGETCAGISQTQLDLEQAHSRSVPPARSAASDIAFYLFREKGSPALVEVAVADLNSELPGTNVKLALGTRTLVCENRRFDEPSKYH